MNNKFLECRWGALLAGAVLGTMAFAAQAQTAAKNTTAGTAVFMYGR